MNKFYTPVISLFLISITGCVYFSGVPPEQKKETDFIPSVVYESLQFYTSDEKGLERSFRVYNEKFEINSVNWIWYEIVIRNGSAADGKMLFTEVWKDNDGNIVLKNEKDMSIKSKDKFLEYSAGIKMEWVPGFYELKLYNDSIELAVREFQIVN